MADKNDILTEKEFSSFQLDKILEHFIYRFIKISCIKPENVSILDYGCGRGRSVLKLLEMGFNAYGIDKDESVLQNGYTLFNRYGYDPAKILFHSDSLKNFPENYFHIIFSEQVIEHLKKQEETFACLFRITKKKGVGIHFFPGWMKIMESHIHMPFIHWIGNRYIRFLSILFFCILGKGPKPMWSELKGKAILTRVKRYSTYIENKTNYLDTRKICNTARSCGFKAVHFPMRNNRNRYIPGLLKRNGFPDSNILLYTLKTDG